MSSLKKWRIFKFYEKITVWGNTGLIAKSPYSIFYNVKR